jgi:hypothetical protein
MTVFSIAGAAFMVAGLGFHARRQRHLGVLACGLGSASMLAAGTLQHYALLIGISTAGVAPLLLWFWPRGPRRRKRVRKELGEESRQLRDGLVCRMRQLRRVTRPAWSPSRHLATDHEATL